jgi:hypothetical protein
MSDVMIKNGSVTVVYANYAADIRLLTRAPKLLALLRRFANSDMRLPHTATEDDMQMRVEARAMIAEIDTPRA